MNTIITLFASVSGLLTVFIFYYNLKIVRKFREDEELTATKLVIKRGIPDAFMALSISSLFFSVGALMGATQTLLRLEVFNYLSELGVITMLVGLLTFMKRISDAVTEENRKQTHEEEREDKEKKEDSTPDDIKEDETVDSESQEESENDETESKNEGS